MDRLRALPARLAAVAAVFITASATHAAGAAVPLPGPVVAGVLVAADGRSVAGCSVYVQGTADTGGSPGQLSAPVAPDGTFSFTAPSGRFQVGGVCPPSQDLLRRIVPGVPDGPAGTTFDLQAGTVTPVALTLPVGGTLDVRGPAGTCDVLIGGISGSTVSTQAQPYPTDDGRLVIPALETGDYRVRIAACDGSSSPLFPPSATTLSAAPSYRVTAGSSASIDAGAEALPAASRIVAHVQTSDGTPVSNVCLTARPRAGQDVTIGPNSTAADGNVILGGVAPGPFTVSVDGLCPLPEGLQAGPVQAAMVSSGADAQVTETLYRTTVVRGRLLDNATGRPFYAGCISDDVGDFADVTSDGAFTMAITPGERTITATDLSCGSAGGDSAALAVRSFAEGSSDDLGTLTGAGSPELVQPAPAAPTPSPTTPTAVAPTRGDPTSVHTTLPAPAATETVPGAHSVAPLSPSPKHALTKVTGTVVQRASSAPRRATRYRPGAIVAAYTNPQGAGTPAARARTSAHATYSLALPAGVYYLIANNLTTHLHLGPAVRVRVTAHHPPSVTITVQR